MTNLSEVNCLRRKNGLRELSMEEYLIATGKKRKLRSVVNNNHKQQKAVQLVLNFGGDRYTKKDVDELNNRFTPAVKTYIMFDKSCGFYKIGKTVDIKTRFNTLKVGNANIELFAVCDADIEKQMHVTFNKQRRQGEWFALSYFDIQTLLNEYGFKLWKNK